MQRVRLHADANNRQGATHVFAKGLGAQDGPCFKEDLIQRWNEGCRNAQFVSRKIKEQGYSGSDQPVARFFAQFRKKKDAGKFQPVDPTKETPITAAPNMALTP